jgi:hypothetical protein
MGLLDKQALFSDQQAVVAAAGNVLATNSYDQGTPGSTVLGGTAVPQDLGRGNKAELLAQVTEQFTSGTSTATVRAQLIQGTGVDGAGQINAGLEVLQETDPILVTALKPGYKFRLGLPHGITKKYISMRYVIAVEATTAGKITSGLVFNKDTANVDG